jgi:hypothetical protein
MLRHFHCCLHFYLSDALVHVPEKVGSFLDGIVGRHFMAFVEMEARACDVSFPLIRFLNLGNS